MDPILVDLAQKGILLLALAYALKWAVGEMKEMQDRRNTEVLAERTRCEQTIASLAERVTTLEDRAYQDNSEREGRILNVAEASSRALAMIAERLPNPTPLGTPIIPPSDHRR